MRSRSNLLVNFSFIIPSTFTFVFFLSRAFGRTEVISQGFPIPFEGL